MYAWYQQFHSPSSVDFCVECNFTAKDAHNLIVVAGTQLTLYNLLADIPVKSKNDNKTQTKDKLEQIGSWQLYGNVASLDAIKLPGTSTDALILSFKFAKLSVICFDASIHDIKTLSLHYFEKDIEDLGLIIKPSVPKTCVDPEGRCACMLISECTLAVLPFASRESSTQSSGNYAWEKLQIVESYNIDLKQVDPQLQNIKDLQFLHGYYEPTLLILYEPFQTCSGRVAVRQDTCNIVAISLNLAEKIHPIIWSLGHLPYNCERALPVPKPIGGVLIFATSAMLYLNQSVPPCGISLNNSNDSSTSFPLSKSTNEAISLDCSNAAFLTSDKLCVALKNGDLYVFTLQTDSMRSIYGFSFEKVAASVMTSCVTTLGSDFIFLGSRLGNCVMLKYTEDVTSEETSENALPATKRQRLNTAADWLATGDDVDVYGPSTAGNKTKSMSFKFDVCDSILNIGPCAYSELGEPAYLSEEFVHQRDADLELVLLSGHGKNGALTILQRSIKPQVVTTFELPGCTNMWTVKGEVKEVVEVGAEEFDSFLILSREQDTLVLETAQEIMEVEKSGFCTQQKTIYAGNVHLGEGDDKLRLILQVCSYGVWLLNGTKKVEHMSLDQASPIVSCSISNSFVSILLKDGQLILLIIRLVGGQPKIIISNPNLQQYPKIEMSHIFKDTNGLFQTEEVQEFPEPEKVHEPAPVIPSAIVGASTIDDEDEMLYGDSSVNVFQNIPKPAPQPQGTTGNSPTQNETYWMFVVRKDCTLEIYSIPDVELVYSIKNCSMGSKLLTDSFAMQSQDTDSSKTYSVDRQRVLEVKAKGFGVNNHRIHLFIRIKQDILVYEAFRYAAQRPDYIQRKCLNIRFKRLSHNMQLKHDGSVTTKAHLCSFDSIGGYSGLFLCGPYAHWFINSPRGVVRYHPMFVDGPVSSFVPFHNVNCPNGFLYFNNRSELRICMLPSHVVYENEWPVKKVQLKRTAHFITYSINHKVYMLASSVEEPCMKIPFLNAEGEKELEELEPKDDFLPPTHKKFSVELISPIKWENIPNSKIDLPEYEHVTCMKNVWLETPINTQRQNYVICGTANVMGEELNCRGRVIVYEVIEVVPEPGKPLTKHKVKQIFQEDQKGPVTALCGVEGYLMCAIGQKMFIMKMDDDYSLRAMAFVDSSVYVHQAFSFKSFVIIADIQKSISLLRFQTDFKTLSIVSRDVRPLVTYSTELVVDGQNVAFLVSDEDKNLLLYAYDPEAHESVGGARLLRWGDINIGANVATMWRTASAMADPATGARNSEYAKRHLTMMAGLDGGLSFFLPISEKIYRRFLMLQNTMVNSLPHVAGLNPKSFRQCFYQSNAIQNPKRNVLDGDLLRRFTQLSFSEKHELSKKIGTTADQLLKDFMEIQKATFVM